MKYCVFCYNEKLKAVKKFSKWRSKGSLNILLCVGWLSGSAVEYVEIKLKFETSQLSWILLETFDFFAPLSRGEPQQQSRTLIQFQPVCRLDVETLGPKDLLDMGHLGALNHLDLEALGVCCSLNLLQLAVLVCWDLLHLVPLDYLYRGEFETFCWQNSFPLSAFGFCCHQLNLFQLQAFDFSYLGRFGTFWHFDPVPASDCFHFGELLVSHHLVLIPLALGKSYQLVSVELGSLAYLYSIALGRSYPLVSVKLGSLANLYLAAHVLVKLGSLLFCDSVELLNLGQDSPCCYLCTRFKALPEKHQYLLQISGVKKIFPPQTWSRILAATWFQHCSCSRHVKLAFPHHNDDDDDYEDFDDYDDKIAW